MKTCCLMSVVLSLVLPGSSIRAEETPKVGFPCHCPIQKLYEIPPEALCLCDYFETTCEQWTDFSFYFGIFQRVPYVNCPDDCADGAHVAKREAKTFPGLPKPVPLDYMREPPKAGQKPVEPGTPAAAVGSVVNKQRDCHFIKFTIGGRDVFAKVIEIRFNRVIALGRKGATEADIGAGWQSIYVAYEVEKNPVESGFEVHPVFKLEQVANLGKYAWRGGISYEIGKSAQVLILLAAESPPEKSQ